MVWEGRIYNFNIIRLVNVLHLTNSRFSSFHPLERDCNAYFAGSVSSSHSVPTSFFRCAQFQNLLSRFSSPVSFIAYLCFYTGQGANQAAALNQFKTRHLKLKSCGRFLHPHLHRGRRHLDLLHLRRLLPRHLLRSRLRAADRLLMRSLHHPLLQSRSLSGASH